VPEKAPCLAEIFQNLNKISHCRKKYFIGFWTDFDGFLREAHSPVSEKIALPGGNLQITKISRSNGKIKMPLGRGIFLIL
jgi:hypothetical protein